jgi:hypothetical protein
MGNIHTVGPNEALIVSGKCSNLHVFNRQSYEMSKFFSDDYD